jgi:hypothetical protein
MKPDKLKADDILHRLESFRKLERKSTDEIGWIALAYSCSRAEAEKMIQAATKSKEKKP